MGAIAISTQYAGRIRFIFHFILIVSDCIFPDDFIYFIYFRPFVCNFFLTVPFHYFLHYIRVLVLRRDVVIGCNAVNRQNISKDVMKCPTNICTNVLSRVVDIGT